MTCISFQVFRGYHDNKSYGSLVAKHFIGPAADRTHTLDCSDAIISNQDLPKKQKAHGYDAGENQILKAAAKYCSYLLYDAVATKTCNELSRRGHSKVSL